MALPEFNGFSLQDDNFITSEIEYRTWPSRPLSVEKIARRPGTKFVAEEFGERRVRMRGFIKGSTAADLQTKIDSLYKYVSPPSKLLQIDSGRFYTATVASITVSDPHYSQTIVPYELELVCADPFAYGTTVSTNYTVTSGTIIQTYTVTINGSFYAEPQFTYTPPIATGNTTTSGLMFKNLNTGDYVLWSGLSPYQYIQYGSSFQFDYKTYKALFGSTQVNQIGVFSRWEPGAQTLQVTYMGNTVGGTLNVTYAPRYL